MSVGKQDKVIVISGRAAGGSDGYGGRSETWTTKWEGFAQVTKKSGSRSIEASAAALGSVYEFMFRKRPGLQILKTDKIEEVRTEGVVDANNDNLNDSDGSAIIRGGTLQKTFTVISVDEDKRWYRVTAAQTS